MRKRTLLAIVAVMIALPALASDPSLMPRIELPTSKPKVNPDTLVVIADVRFDAACNEKTLPANRAMLLDSARDEYQRALAIDPQHKGALLGLARYYAHTEQKDRAVETYKTYLKHYPKDAEIAHEVAITHAKWKDWTSAIAWCEKTLSIDAENRSARKTMGFCFASCGRWDEAFAALCRAMPEAQARHNLAGLLKHTGQAEKAKEQLRLALKADPNYAPALDLLREMSVAVPVPNRLPFATDGGLGAAIGAAIPVAKDNKLVPYNLRNVAASDAANAIHTFLTQNKLQGRVTADVPNNNLFVDAQPEVQKQIAEMLAKLDEPVKQVVMQVMVIEVPREFITDAGLNIGGKPGQTAWTLSAREVQMLTGLIRAAKARQECDVLSRPQIQLCEGQTGCVQVGQEIEVVTTHGIQLAGGVSTIERKSHKVPLGITMQFNPRIASDSQSVTIQTSAQVSTLAKGTVKMPVTVEVPGLPFPLTQFVEVPAFHTQSVETTAKVRFGETLVLATSNGSKQGRSFCGALKDVSSSEQRVTLFIVTPVLVGR